MPKGEGPRAPAGTSSGGQWTTLRGRGNTVAHVSPDRSTVAVEEAPFKRRRGESDLSASYRQQQQRDKAREKATRAATRYGVYLHSIDGKPTGRGYVARPIGADPRNYGSAEMVAGPYKVRSAAERKAEALTDA